MLSTRLWHIICVEDHASKAISFKAMEDPKHKVPKISESLAHQIRLLRRDVGELLFHFTRTPKEESIAWSIPQGGQMITLSSAFAVLRKVLYETKLEGTSTWTYGQKCVLYGSSYYGIQLYICACGNRCIEAGAPSVRTIWRSRKQEVAF